MAVRKPVGELKLELIDVQTVMNKLKDVTSFHLVPDLVNKHNIIFGLNGLFNQMAWINLYFSGGYG